MLEVRLASVLAVLVLFGCQSARSVGGDATPTANESGDGALRPDKRTPDLVRGDAPSSATRYCKVAAPGGGGAGRPCSSDIDCRDTTPWRNWFCHAQTGTCGNCNDDADCPDPSLPHCVIQEIAVASCGTCMVALCSRCIRDNECAQGPADTGKCALSSGTCTRCDTDPDCVNGHLGLVCDPASHHCHPCVKDADCKRGDHDTGRCWLKDGTCTGCDADSDCAQAFSNGEAVCVP
jgi:hypothetical protein